MISVSTGISASTSVGVKYRSATKAAFQEHGVDLLGPVHTAREGQLDVRGATRPGDDVDRTTAPGGRLAVVPRLEKHPDLPERLDQRLAIEDSDVIRRQQRRRTGPPGAREQDERTGLGDGEVDAGQPQIGRRDEIAQRLSFARGSD